MRTVPRNQRMATAQCKECGAKRQIPDANYTLGQMLKPYAGGGDYGYCLRCKRTGTLMIIELPPQGPILPPTGWTKDPGDES